MSTYKIHKFPKSRIATFDIGAISKKKHYISALLECDVTDSRIKIRDFKRQTGNISFTAWLLKTIGDTIKRHEIVAGYLYKKQKTITFDDINISMIVEKSVDGKKVPIPLVVEKVNEKDIQTITREIEKAKTTDFSNKNIVLNEGASASERLYYAFPGFLRRTIWKFLLKHPKTVYKKMGNVIVTSVGMMGQVNGWFVHTSVHPISFGIGSVIKKPAVYQDNIAIREILNMTVLIDHNVVDGAPMARFIAELTKNIERGYGLSNFNR